METRIASKSSMSDLCLEVAAAHDRDDRDRLCIRNAVACIRCGLAEGRTVLLRNMGEIRQHVAAHLAQDHRVSLAPDWQRVVEQALAEPALYTGGPHSG